MSPILLFTVALAQESAKFSLASNWEIVVDLSGSATQKIEVLPLLMIEVKAEQYTSIPVFNPKAGGWVRGTQLKGVRAQETTSPHLLDAISFTLRAGPESDALLFTKGVDYEIDLTWGTFGRSAESRIEPNQAVYATYRHAQQRLDAVVLTAEGKIELRRGEPRAAAPSAPQPNPGERHLGNIYLPGMTTKLQAHNLFPVLETAYPESPIPTSATITRLRKRLTEGAALRILAWGDSVTDGSYIKNPGRWQEQFVARLRLQFPKARIELITQAWGGRNTGSYLAEPPGSPHNYSETVLGVKPDLVISEFVNDAGLKPDQVEERYAKLLADFKQIGAEWIILTPHYVRPDWMGLTRERDIDQDPRPHKR